MKQRFMKRFARRISKEGELVIHSHRYRDQGRNVADCLHKLREMVLEVARRAQETQTGKSFSSCQATPCRGQASNFRQKTVPTRPKIGRLNSTMVINLRSVAAREREYRIRSLRLFQSKDATLPIVRTLRRSQLIKSATSDRLTHYN